MKTFQMSPPPIGFSKDPAEMKKLLVGNISHLRYLIIMGNKAIEHRDNLIKDLQEQVQQQKDRIKELEDQIYPDMDPDYVAPVLTAEEKPF